MIMVKYTKKSCFLFVRFAETYLISFNNAENSDLVVYFSIVIVVYFSITIYT